MPQNPDVRSEHVCHECESIIDDHGGCPCVFWPKTPIAPAAPATEAEAA